MTTAFERLCGLTRYQEPRDMEDISTPRDASQTAWAQVLSFLRTRGPLPEATTSEELHEQYEPNGGLLVVQNNREIMRTYKNRTQSLDQLVAASADFDVPDSRVDKEFEQVEAHIDTQAAFTSLFTSLDEKQRAAVDRFIEVWEMKERGEKIPNKMSRQLIRDRELTGLAFSLTSDADTRYLRRKNLKK